MAKKASTSQREAELQAEVAMLKRQLAEQQEDLAILKKAAVDSICQRNTHFKYLFGRFEAQCLSWSRV
ncbi:hypothetical protein GCM10023333_05610 [Ferrimonas pelagia]|uniref:Transposase n=1 Tax=Ferrimonas pelagia TaxID=1177826 RepID=A0ABP9EDC2_9GAMM